MLTRDPEEAEFFFVPLYGECYLYQQTALCARARRRRRRRVRA